MSARDCEDMRTKLRMRYLLPGMLVVGVAVVGLLSAGADVSQAATPPAKVALKSATSAANAFIT